MNTVDALKDLYKTLCGKDYAGDPNPTDAEMIKAIAKDASTGGGGSGSGGIKIKAVMTDLSAPPVVESLEPELTVEQLTGAVLYMYGEVTSEPILPITEIVGTRGEPVSVGTVFSIPKVGDIVTVHYGHSGSLSDYECTLTAGSNGAVVAGFMNGILTINSDGAVEFTPTAVTGQMFVGISISIQPPIKVLGATSLIVSVTQENESTILLGPVDSAPLIYDRVSGEITAE